ncbi:hypothetical protein, partial [Chryseobacterium sp. CH1]|uniref:hypothetical protein n=1 Tax=Chryseobacterium sp. CH1 TaxID=713551 RepID=UPI0010253A93
NDVGPASDWNVPTGNAAIFRSFMPVTVPYRYFPKSTPFRLEGSASDIDNNPLTYCWEQNDVGPASDWNVPTGNAAIFRSFMPVTVPYRYFP